MKRMITTITLGVFLLALLPFHVCAQQLLVPVGKIVGLHLSDDTVTVAAFDEKLGTAAREAGVKVGDQLLEVEGQPIQCAQDVGLALNQAPEDVTLTIVRDGKRRTVHMMPTMTRNGPKLGLYLRQGVSGIGTVTWYDPGTGTFGSLGHGVSSSRGDLVGLKEGNIYPAEIASVVPGKSGEPGLLKGNADSQQVIGSLYRNTPQGVFGKAPGGWQGQPLPVAEFGDVHPGEAKIRSTVDGQEPKEYSVEILKIYPRERENCRNFLLKVTDPELLQRTGGIVQGMSGSPIIQDGKLIGAVTHVLVNDPQTGYGIFIENMLDAAA